MALPIRFEPSADCPSCGCGLVALVNLRKLSRVYSVN
jgi:hypothetical protein